MPNEAPFAAAWGSFGDSLQLYGTLAALQAGLGLNCGLYRGSVMVNAALALCVCEISNCRNCVNLQLCLTNRRRVGRTFYGSG